MLKTLDSFLDYAYWKLNDIEKENNQKYILTRATRVWRIILFDVYWSKLFSALARLLMDF